MRSTGAYPQIGPMLNRLFQQRRELEKSSRGLPEMICNNITLQCPAVPRGKHAHVPQPEFFGRGQAVRLAT